MLRLACGVNNHLGDGFSAVNRDDHLRSLIKTNGIYVICYVNVRACLVVGKSNSILHPNLLITRQFGSLISGRKGQSCFYLAANGRLCLVSAALISGIFNRALLGNELQYERIIRKLVTANIRVALVASCAERVIRAVYVCHKRFNGIIPSIYGGRRASVFCINVRAAYNHIEILLCAVDGCINVVSAVSLLNVEVKSVFLCFGSVYVVSAYVSVLKVNNLARVFLIHNKLV